MFWRRTRKFNVCLFVLMVLAPHFINLEVGLETLVFPGLRHAKAVPHNSIAFWVLLAQHQKKLGV